MNNKNIAYKNNLKKFMQKAFNVINPGTKFLDNWHLDLISKYLEAASKSKIKRLIINIPPRSLKSTIASICWPAWLIGNNPTRRIICASYSQNLSNKLSLDCRHLMQSDFFRKIYPKLSFVKDQNEKNKFVTSERGFRVATSVGGTITGEGGDFLILDDPHNAIEANSLRKRENAINWFQQSFASRLDNKKTGAIIIIMQRLHLGDLTGFLLDNQLENWELLSIPYVSPITKFYKFDDFEYEFKKGVLLHEDREGKEEMLRAKKELGSYTFSAQYLQNPISDNGGMLKKSWIKYYKQGEVAKEYDHIVQSWDTAIKAGGNNDYSVCTTWGRIDKTYYLLDVFRDKMEYPTLKTKIITHATEWKPDIVLIEDKASGQSLLQDLRMDRTPFSFIAIMPKNDKIVRFARATIFFENGQIMLPKDATWLLVYEEEIFAFPNIKHNDQVDSTSQYMQYILDNQMMATPNIRRL